MTNSLTQLDPNMTNSPTTPLDTKPYRGTKDMFPEDYRLSDYVFKVWRQTAQSFGYEEYAGPFLEPIELYLSKTSQEIVNEQLYHFHDKGERHLAIRPEMTPTMARMVASRSRQLNLPIRWYSIATCMRFERPQRSRQRQFDQFNLDILGQNPHDENVEVLLTVWQTMQRLGASPKDFQIRVNHRGLVNDVLQILSIPDAQQGAFLRLMDAAGKLDESAFFEAARTMGIADEITQKARDFMNADWSSVKALLGESNESMQSLDKVLTELHVACPEGVGTIMFSPQVMRGFDYYTGLVFEVFDTDPQNHRALFGGGRYDNLVGSFGAPPLSGVGYGVSDIALINFMTTHNILPDIKRHIDVFVFAMDDVAKASVTGLAMGLRQRGLMVEQGQGQRKVAKLFAHGAKIGARACAFVGSSELSQGVFGVKWLETGSQTTYSLSYLDDFVSSLA